MFCCFYDINFSAKTTEDDPDWLLYTVFVLAERLPANTAGRDRVIAFTATISIADRNRFYRDAGIYRCNCGKQHPLSAYAYRVGSIFLVSARNGFTICH